MGSSSFQSEKAEPATVCSTADFKDRRESPSGVREWLSSVLVRKWKKRKASVNKRFFFIVLVLVLESRNEPEGGGIYRRREKRKKSGGGRCGVVGSERFMRGKRLEKDEILIRMGSTSRQQREREREEKGVSIREKGRGVEAKQLQVIRRVWTYA